MDFLSGVLREVIGAPANCQVSNDGVLQMAHISLPIGGYQGQNISNGVPVHWRTSAVIETYDIP